MPNFMLHYQILFNILNIMKYYVLLAGAVEHVDSTSANE